MYFYSYCNFTNYSLTDKIKLVAEDNNKNNVNIELSPEVAEGTYCNLAFIAHSDSEFVVDFINMMPGTPKGVVKSRIILTPQHAKRLHLALLENIKKFEKSNGEIQLKNNNSVLPMNFDGNIGEA